MTNLIPYKEIYVWGSRCPTMNDLIKFIIVVVLLSTIYLYIDSKNSSLTYVRSEIDGNMYLVRNVEDKQNAANLLSSVRQKLERVTDYLTKKYPDKDNVMRLKLKFRPENIEESEAGSKYTSYSVNKGEKIVFCIRSKDKEARLEDENTLMFVALHEIGHVMTKSTGHTEEFWDNFKFLLKEAIKIGVYKRQIFVKTLRNTAEQRLRTVPCKQTLPSHYTLPHSNTRQNTCYAGGSVCRHNTVQGIVCSCMTCGSLVLCNVSYVRGLHSNDRHGHCRRRYHLHQNRTR